MSTFKILTKWLLELDPDDAALVLKALGGRLNAEEDISAAKELGDKLTKQRAVQAKMLAEQMEAHAKKVA